MNGRLNQEYQLPKTSQKKSGQLNTAYRRPFWIPASSYYFIVSAGTLVFFLMLWVILHEDEEDMPLLLAGIGASLFLGGAIIVREIFLRKARFQYLAAERKLDNYVRNNSMPRPFAINDSGKLTLEKNAQLIKEVQKKSDSVRALGNIASGHLEVFEVCREYLSVTEKQMETAGAGSPRLVGFRRGREIVGELHRFHLMSWAEIESRTLTQKSQNYVTISDKLNAAQEALRVLETALQLYPNESQLIESEAALKNFIVSIRISHWVEQAERAAFKGNNKRAVSLYRDALFFLAREDVKSEERRLIAEKINSEIESLRESSANKKLSNEKI